MQRIVLLGSNIAHSRSPYLHNHLFERYRLPYRYELMPLEPDEVVGAVEMMKRGGYRGANITSPHKQRALPALDELSAEAVRIGAVNTILFEDGRAIGHNTDLYGFARSLAGLRLLEEPLTAAVLGTGGAAMAAVHVLLGYPMLESLTLYSRDADRAALAALRWNDPRLHGAGVDRFEPATLVVHATPVGLPGRSGLPFPPERLPGTTMLYEMIYSPAETELTSAARALGIETMNGRSMFIAQAAEAFRLWTGVEMREEDVPEGMWGGEGVGGP